MARPDLPALQDDDLRGDAEVVLTKAPQLPPAYRSRNRADPKIHCAKKYAQYNERQWAKTASDSKDQHKCSAQYKQQC